MARWLAVAERLFRGEKIQPPPPFEVTCACGQTVAGQRTAAVQTPHCPVCGASLFILPASVYPTPKAPKRKVVASTKAPAEVAPDPAAEADRRAGLPHKVIGNVRKA